MNKENILAVADAIEGHKIPGLGFNMEALVEIGWPDRSGENCTTVACIAGWAVCVRHNLPADPYSFGVLDDAREWLGLSWSKASSLFSPVGFDYFATTPAQAVRVLRHLAETGDVDWSVANYGANSVATSEPTNAR